MKRYVVNIDTIILGRPVLEGDFVELDDERAKEFLFAGLVRVEGEETAPVKATPAKKVGK